MRRRYNYVFFYSDCRGSGLELLSAFLSLAVCHDSNVKRLRKLITFVDYFSAVNAKYMIIICKYDYYMKNTLTILHILRICIKN